MESNRRQETFDATHQDEDPGCVVKKYLDESYTIANLIAQPSEEIEKCWHQGYAEAAVAKIKRIPDFQVAKHSIFSVWN